MTNEIKLSSVVFDVTMPVDMLQDYVANAVSEALAQRDADHLAELRAYELTVANLREQLAQRGEPVAWKWRFPDGDLSESPFESRSECERDAVGYDGEAIPLYTHPQVPREQLAQQAPQVAHPDNLEQIIDDYVDDYVMEGDDGTHWPTESEKCLLKDAVMGLLADPEWNSAWGKIVEGSKQAPQVPMTEDEIVKCLVESSCIGKVMMSFESGPYDITRTSINADWLVRAIEAHHGIKEKP